MNKENKVNLIFWSAMIFLFGQLVILKLADIYLVTGTLIITWGIAVLCGWYSHWCLIYIKNHKTLEEDIKND